MKYLRQWFFRFFSFFVYIFFRGFRRFLINLQKIVFMKICLILLSTKINPCEFFVEFLNLGASFSSNVNEVIREALNSLFFLRKVSHTHILTKRRMWGLHTKSLHFSFCHYVCASKWWMWGLVSHTKKKHKNAHNRTKIKKTAFYAHKKHLREKSYLFAYLRFCAFAWLPLCAFGAFCACKINS